MPGITVYAVKVENCSAFVRHHIGALHDRRDLSALDHDVLIFDRRSTGAINNPRVREHNLGSAHPAKLLHRGGVSRRLGTLGTHGEREQQQHKGHAKA